MKSMAVMLLGLACLVDSAHAASSAKKLAGHWISFADSAHGTHQPGDVIMLSFNRAGAFAWQHQTKTFAGNFTADGESLVLVDSSTGRSTLYSFRFYEDNLILESEQRLTTTFVQTRQGPGDVEAILASVAKARVTPMPRPAQTAPVEVVKVMPALVTSEPKRPAKGSETECIQHLGRIYVAIQQYRKDHKDTPGWLSDMVPHYLSAADLLCPSGRTPGDLLFGLDDPKLRVSYTYEFCNAPVPAALGGGSSVTMKQWRRSVMALVGGGTPMVRCHLHDRVLNVSFDGEFYESERDWERLPRFSDKVNPRELAPPK